MYTYIYIYISNQVADPLSLLYLPDFATAFLTDFFPLSVII